MIEITTWMSKFLQILNENFGDRVWFVGLQGSHGRGEATETSDIDIVVILDELSALDIQTYSTMLDTLSYRELICGFLSGKKEILNWDASELFQFYYDTKPIKGSLDELLLLIDDVAVNRAIKIGVCNIFHGCVHNMLFEKSEEILRGLYKSASFVIQAICFKQTGNYISHQKDLLEIVSPDERAIVDTFLSSKNGGIIYFNEMSETLFTWSKNWIRRMPVNKDDNIICAANIQELKDILVLQKLAYKAEAEIYGDYSIPPLLQTLDELTEETKKSIILKYIDNGKIVGSVRAFKKDGTCYIGKLIVHPDYQNKGIGKKLMAAIEKYFEGLRYELFTGHLSEKNLALYEKLGYHRFKTEKVHDGLSFVYMEKQ